MDPTILPEPFRLEQRYSLQMAPSINGETLAFSPPFIIEPQGQSPLETEKSSWRMTHFGTDDASGTRAPQADFDADGLSNLMERGLGANPTRAQGLDGALCLPRGWTHGSQAGIAFSLPTEPHQDLLYEVQTSSDLQEWVTLAQKSGNTPWQKLRQDALIETAPDPDKDRVSVRVALESNQPEGLPERGFNLRLRVTESP